MAERTFEGRCSPEKKVPVILGYGLLTDSLAARASGESPLVRLSIDLVFSVCSPANGGLRDGGLSKSSDLFGTRVWCIPGFGAENKSALFQDFPLLSAEF